MVVRIEPVSCHQAGDVAAMPMTVLKNDGGDRIDGNLDDGEFLALLHKATVGESSGAEKIGSESLSSNEDQEDIDDIGHILQPYTSDPEYCEDAQLITLRIRRFLLEVDSDEKDNYSMVITTEIS